MSWDFLFLCNPELDSESILIEIPSRAENDTIFLFNQILGRWFKFS